MKIAIKMKETLIRTVIINQIASKQEWKEGVTL